MHAGINEFIEEQTHGLAQMAEQLRRTRVAAAREAARRSAERIKSLNGRLRHLSRSGVRLNAISHGTVQSLIQLQEEIVTSALGDAAQNIERIAYTESVRDLAREQAQVLHSARERILADLTRALTILKQAANEAREAARPAPAAAARPASRKAKRPAKKAKRKVVAAARPAKTRRR